MIRSHGRRMAAALAITGLALTGCGAASANQPPSAVKPIVQSGPDGAQLIVLNSTQTQRLGLQTQPVRPASGKGGGTVVPFSALLYDDQGANWVFVRTPTGAFERQRVTVERIVGDTVILRSGPAVDTPVVTVGAPELLGAQLGVGGE